MFWLELFATAIVLLVGFVLVLKPLQSSRVIENFYKNYPLIRGKVGRDEIMQSINVEDINDIDSLLDYLHDRFYDLRKIKCKGGSNYSDLNGIK
jgi:hypothetical protein